MGRPVRDDGRADAAPVAPTAGGSGSRPVPDVCTLAVPDDALDSEWEALALATGGPPFLRPGWVRAWMAAFAPRRHLRLLTVRRDGDLVALLPVLTGIRGVAPPVNKETPMMQALAVDDRALAALVPGLLSRGPRADLRLVPEDDSARALVAAAEAQGFTSRCEVIRRSPYTRVDGDWETFQRSILSRSRRKSLRRLEHKLRAQGQVGFEVHDGSRNLPALLEEGLGLELAGWKGAQRIAVLARPQTAQFYRSVAEWAATAGILRLYFLRLDGRPIAFGYRLEQQGVIYALKIAHAEKFQEYGPGLLLKNRLLADAFDRPDVHLVDWLPGATPHKLDFASGVRQLLRLQLFSGGATGVLERGLATALSTARERTRRRLSEERRTQIRRALGIDRVRPAAPTEPSMPRDDGTT
jgi:CelD/BcsL family acetyltransferase involved in cellulose biosynthesis